MFYDNPFKVEIIKNKVPDGENCTAYRCGPLIDLCRGPHVPNTSYIKAMEVTSNSSAYWLGKAENPSLQRVYGISFPNKKQMKEHKKWVQEMANRAHQKVGEEQQKLFFFHPLSPGSAFFLPHGARIYNALVDFIKSEYWKRGYHEVITPNVFHTDLWQTSGHYANYKENMFMFHCENQEFGVKPMNCPGHCLMFKKEGDVRSYRDLPIRMADFGVLHRNEISGALSGLTRVRRFQQDDAHIFCREDQITAEVAGVLDMLQSVYGIFGFTFNLQLSTRPAKFLGKVEVWDSAEKALSESLDAAGLPWKINPGDGAFYGPKIDITLRDALQRSHQCATIQLDFQLPERFNLAYVDENGEKTRPVIIHRAILGSCERMIAILTENFAGKWPFWLSPRQVMVVPVAPPFNDYAKHVQRMMHSSGFCADADTDDSNTMNKKVRNAQLAQYNFIFVVGEKERSNETVNVRTRDNKVHGEFTLSAVLSKFKELSEERILNSEEWEKKEE